MLYHHLHLELVKRIVQLSDVDPMIDIYKEIRFMEHSQGEARDD